MTKVFLNKESFIPPTPVDDDSDPTTPAIPSVTADVTEFVDGSTGETYFWNGTEFKRKWNEYYYPDYLNNPGVFAGKKPAA